jgi:3-dehydroquinate synthase
VFDFNVASHKGIYSVKFMPGGSAGFLSQIADTSFVIIDKRVFGLYRSELEPAMKKAKGFIEVEALESNKDARKSLDIAERLIEMGLRRNDTLVAIGGGIIQDITCFLASTLLRGIPWLFIPTTLLSQCDSCIGSKSSINLGKYKNILGTFLPPKGILVDTNFLRTLSDAELRSGAGEMFKVHGLSGDNDFFDFAKDYDHMFSDHNMLLRRIVKSLEIKKTFIEKDEFDTGIRNLLNYGHSFGHAIESATSFQIPHGVAVSIGLDIANFVSEYLNLTVAGHFERAHPILRKNYKEFYKVPLASKQIIDALGKDKKNTASALVLILRDKAGKFSKTEIVPDNTFELALTSFISKYWDNKN